MTLLHAITLGIIEGVTEFLPVSSTGHLILVSHILGIVNSDFTKSFEIFIQLGAIFALIVFYFRRLVGDFPMWRKLIVGFIPTAVIGVVFYSFIKHYLLGNVSVVLAALFFGGIILIIFEYWKPLDGSGTVESLSYKQAFLIGAAQAVAIIPGVSRSAATIVAGRGIGLSRKAAVEFSFMLSIPTLLAASLFDLLKNGATISNSQAGLLAAGFISSAIVAGLAIVSFLKFVRNRSFVSFGIYRIIISLVFLAILFI